MKKRLSPSKGSSVRLCFLVMTSLFCAAPHVVLAQNQENVAVLSNNVGNSKLTPVQRRNLEESIQDGLRDALPGMNVHDHRSLKALLGPDNTLEECHAQSRCKNEVFREIQMDYGVLYQVTQRPDGQYAANIWVTHVDDNGRILERVRVVGFDFEALKRNAKRKAKTNLAQAMSGGTARGEVQWYVIDSVPSGAAISINNLPMPGCEMRKKDEVRRTGECKVPLAPGKHLVTMTLDDYQTFSQKVDTDRMKDGRFSQKLKFGKAKLRVEVDPDFEIELLLQGRMKFPMTATQKDQLRSEGALLLPQQYTVRAVHECYRDQSENKRMEAGGEYTVRFEPKPHLSAFTLEVLDGNGMHMEATARVDDQPAKTVPGKALFVVPRCSQQLFVSVPGSGSKTVELEAYGLERGSQLEAPIRVKF